eukprot:gene42091-52177_t
MAPPPLSPLPPHPQLPPPTAAPPGSSTRCWLRCDAPRHALNGVFVKDLIAAAPWSDPSRYAYDYYAQYPALTILFYPPLFYAISAPFYALFGVSEGTALLVVALHYVAFAWGAWALFSSQRRRQFCQCSGRSGSQRS